MAFGWRVAVGPKGPNRRVSKWALGNGVPGFPCRGDFRSSFLSTSSNINVTKSLFHPICGERLEPGPGGGLCVLVVAGQGREEVGGPWLLGADTGRQCRQLRKPEYETAFQFAVRRRRHFPSPFPRLQEGDSWAVFSSAVKGIVLPGESLPTALVVCNPDSSFLDLVYAPLS